MFKEAISKIVERHDLTMEQAREVMDEIMGGRATPAQIGGFLTAMRMKGETAEETALREVKEETGLDGEIVQKIGKISYSFTWKKHFLKTVHFYLLRFLGGSIRNHDYEVDRVKWLPLSEATQALTYASEKKIVEKAGKILAEKGQP